MIYNSCVQYTWRAGRQDKKPKMTPANNYDTELMSQLESSMSIGNKSQQLAAYTSMCN